MDVKQAVRKAVEYIADIYADADIKHVDVEEIAFDEAADTWNITIGFFRHWEQPMRGAMELMARLEQRQWKKRTFKVVRLNDHDGRVVSMTHRELNALD